MKHYWLCLQYFWMGIHVSAHHQLCCLTSLPDPRLSSLPLSGPSDLYKLKSHCTLILVQINAPTVSLRFQGIQSAPSHPPPPFLPDCRSWPSSFYNLSSVHHPFSTMPQPQWLYSKPLSIRESLPCDDSLLESLLPRIFKSLILSISFSV